MTPSAKKVARELDNLDVGFVHKEGGKLSLQRLGGKTIDTDFADRVKSVRDELLVEARRRAFDNAVALSLTLADLDSFGDELVLVLRDSQHRVLQRTVTQLLTMADSRAVTLSVFLRGFEMTLVSAEGR